MKTIHVFLYLVFFLFSSFLYSQEKTRPLNNKFVINKEDKVPFDKAETLFAKGKYLMALENYIMVEQNYPEELYLKFKIGICYLYKSDNYNKALEYLEKVWQERPNTTDLNFYLGRAYHYNNKFDEAIEKFDENLKQQISKENKQTTLQYIENSKNGKMLFLNPTDVKIYNIGSPINTTESEYVPVISSDESVMIYTYRGEKSIGGLQDEFFLPDPEGEYFEDIYVSTKEDEAWLNPIPIGNSINTPDHDASIAISNDGQKLFIYQYNLTDRGDICISYLDGNIWSTPEKLKGQVNTKAWEGSASLSSDEKTLYFSSERPGGYGGRDIYKATLQADESWGDVKNLGPVINTPLDDDAPFIHPDGLILHFSSKGHNSMGGYDIFRADLQEDGTWTKPYNLGYPVNTADHDIYYVLSADGKRGYYSSGKPGGYGQQDIYVVEPGLIGKRAALVLVKGVVTLDDKPVKAEILVAFDDGKEQGIYNSNSVSGKYLVNFPAGNNYKITYKIDGFDDQVKTINTIDVDSFLEATIDVQFYSKNFAIEKTVPDTAEFKEETKKESTELTYVEILEKFGEINTEGLIFKVQVGAYNLPDNFNYSNLLTLGKVERQKYEDGIVRFTIGSFNTLKEADEFKIKVIAKGTTDAFVTALYKGKRMYLKDLAGVMDK